MSDLDWLTARPIAHRGYHDHGAGRIENTLAAAAAAIEHDFAVECDVRITADNRVVVFHDTTLDRLTNASGRVDRASLDELRAARFSGGDGHIPTLEELLDLVDGRAPLVIELKPERLGGHPLAAAVAAILADYVGPLAVMSFDPTAVAAMRRLAPTRPRGLIASHMEAGDWPALPPPTRLVRRHLLPALYALPHFVAYDVKALPASAPLALRHFFGLPLLTWTVRDAADRAVARQWADQMIFEGFDPDVT